MKGLGGHMRFWLGAGTILALAGCDVVGNPVAIVTGERKTPDEFQVLARKPLKMPGTLDLPEPRLGETSPLEPDPTTDAVVALLGVPVANASTQPSAGEQALLSAANASAADSQSAAQLEQAERAVRETQPYQPPTLLELLEGEEEDPDTLVPAEEARRLQTEGVAAAPVDPNAVPVEETAQPQRPRDGDTFYDGSNQRPNNLPRRPNTGTAF